MFVSKCKVWKLKNPEMQQVFKSRVEKGLADRQVGDVEVVWGSLKECLLTVAEEVCGKTGGKQRHRETWWWNDEVAEFVKETRRLFKIYERSKRGSDERTIEEDKRRYDDAKRAAKRVISKAQEVERRKFGVKLEEENEKGTIFRVAKQIVRNNRDVVGGGCVKDADGRIVVDEDRVMEVWRRHYEKLSNEKFLHCGRCD